MSALFNQLSERLQQSSWIAKIVTYFDQLSDRDQLAVKILVGFLLPVVLTFAVLMPATDFMSGGIGRYQAALEDFRWIEANRNAVSSGSASNQQEAGQSLFGVANATSKGYRISFKRYEPMGDNTLSLWIEGVSFNNVILWLERLDKRHGVSVREISVARQDEPGRVNVRLVIQG